MVWWQVVVGVATALLLVWLLLVGVLWRLARNGRRHGLAWRDAVRLLPDVVRLLRRLAGDTSLPSGVRIRMWLLLAYLALPVDLIPDFIPVIGFADDIIIVAAGLRSVIRRAGPGAIEQHWPGTSDGLQAVRVLARLSRPEGHAEA